MLRHLRLDECLAMWSFDDGVVAVYWLEGVGSLGSLAESLGWLVVRVVISGRICDIRC